MLTILAIFDFVFNIPFSLLSGDDEYLEPCRHWWLRQLAALHLATRTWEAMRAKKYDDARLYSQAHSRIYNSRNAGMAVRLLQEERRQLRQHEKEYSNPDLSWLLSANFSRKQTRLFQKQIERKEDMIRALVIRYHCGWAGYSEDYPWDFDKLLVAD